VRDDVGCVCGRSVRTSTRVKWNVNEHEDDVGCVCGRSVRTSTRVKWNVNEHEDDVGAYTNECERARWWCW
jgi:galactitol-specific phosphotransferase system IIB component